MNVIISNKFRDALASLDIDVIKKLDGEFSVEEIIETVKNFQVPEVTKSLPSCPEHAILYHEEPNRPQPRLDRDLENGMATSIGRIRKDTILDYRFVSVSHNTIRGAAGGSILNGELIARRFFGK